jgi:hypothetical protein
MNWTKKHDEFCLEKGIKPSAKSLWQWLLEKGGEGEREPDLADFNKWIEKHRGKPFHRDTIKQAFNQLVETGAITTLKKFTWKVWRIVVRSIDAVIGAKPKQRKNSHNRDRNRTLPPSNPDSAVAQDIAAAALDSMQLISQLPEEEVQILEQNLETCEAAGITFSAKESAEILSCEPEDLKQAIALFQKRGGHSKIKNPEGWLRRCLDGLWWESKRPTFQDVLTQFAALFVAA